MKVKNKVNRRLSCMNRNVWKRSKNARVIRQHVSILKEPMNQEKRYRGTKEEKKKEGTKKGTEKIKTKGKNR